VTPPESFDPSGEGRFLSGYSLEDFDRPSVTADIAMFTMRSEESPLYRLNPEPQLCLLLIRRGEHPFLGKWALPGGFAEPGEAIEKTAARELYEETHVAGIAPELVGVFSAPGRDPRGWVVSVLFTALVDAKPQAKAGDDAREAAWFDTDALPALAFDHAEMIRAAMAQVLTK
jgi:ADP-ribose pyrophosphatase YjhB (NUDIX family)